MGYQKTTHLLPEELLVQVQEYAEGKVIYIPKKQSNKKHWGENTDTKRLLAARNRQICREFQSGMSVKQLSEKYFLAEKSIQRILNQQKPK